MDSFSIGSIDQILAGLSVLSIVAGILYWTGRRWVSSTISASVLAFSVLLFVGSFIPLKNVPLAFSVLAFRLRLELFSFAWISIYAFCLLGLTLGRRFLRDRLLYVNLGMGAIAFGILNALESTGLFANLFSSEAGVSGSRASLCTYIPLGVLLVLLASRSDMERLVWRRYLKSARVVTIFGVWLVAGMASQIRGHELNYLQNAADKMLVDFRKGLETAIDESLDPVNGIVESLHETGFPKESEFRSLAGLVTSESPTVKSIILFGREGVDQFLKVQTGDLRLSEQSIRRAFSFFGAGSPYQEAPGSLRTGRSFALAPLKENALRPYVTALLPVGKGVKLMAVVDVGELVKEAEKHLDTSFFSVLVRYGKIEGEPSSKVLLMPTSTSFSEFGIPFEVTVGIGPAQADNTFTGATRLLMFLGFWGVILLSHLLCVHSELAGSYGKIEVAVKVKTRELEEAKRRAEVANESKSIFLANMSHEIRTPLNILMGVGGLLSETSLTEQQLKYMGMYRQAASNLLELVNDLIDMSKIEAGKIELDVAPLNLEEFLNSIIGLYRIKAMEKGLEIKVGHGKLLHPIVMADHLRLRQVIGNILTNAIKYTERGSITVSTASRGSKTVFVVEDSGIGIAREHLGSIFERFARVNTTSTRTVGGAGLGLPIAKQLATLMGGEIRVESQKGEGSRFEIELELRPAARDSAVPLSIRSSSAVDRLPEGLKILLVDDFDDNRELIKAYLRSQKVDIDEASDGQTALEMVKSKVYDVICMDMQMPIKDGYEATQSIRDFETSGNRRRVPILAITAHAQKSDREKCLQAGCDDYLPKPVRKTELISAICRILADESPSVTRQHDQASVNP